ncbi:tRNA (N(6)-L-threonylcarbamoyladenosine(37)-C(2))- methylthiotransferase MtaB [Planctomycetales bacterium]|nr:tRNA (N(6)-L-threonylcarbamoyladenosine(37)-C(2))- methylthiotransferase MtaB [Planctomycetales bacterium]
MFFRLYTLGCKVNYYETEFLRAGLLRLGYREVPNDSIADLVVVNTCTVTAESDAKSRKVIRRLIKENPGAEVVVMGCSATRQPDLILQINGVSQVLTDKQQIPLFLSGLSKGQGGELNLTNQKLSGCLSLQGGTKCGEQNSANPLENFRTKIIVDHIETFGNRHRAFVKVQDGCIVGCSYCIIPKVRPVLKSRPIDEVLTEINALVQNGYREIVLTGIHLGHYGVDLPDKSNKTPLAELVRNIVQVDERFRIRLSSLEAVEVSDELIDTMLAYPDRICPHLHLSMQSGSDAVLKRMKRRWLREPFIERCETIAKRFDRLALTTDVIVGFPGETDEDFAATCDAVERLRFSKVHIFRFSPRESTEAAAFMDRVSSTIQKKRAAQLGLIADRLRKEFEAECTGMPETVLTETEFTGTTSRYLEVRFDKPQQVGTLIGLNVM